MRLHRGYIKFFISFFLIYAFLYYGTYAFIGLSTKGGRYISWLAYIDYVSGYRYILLAGAATVLEWLGYYTQFRSKYVLYINGAVGIQLVYWCLGIGVLSFWVAYVVAYTKDAIVFRLKWVAIGIVVITLLNILRIIFILISYYELGRKTAGIDHHDIYNVLLYLVVFGLLFVHRKKQVQDIPNND